MSISRQEWADWVRSPVTQAVTQALEEEVKKSLDQLIQGGISDKSLETCGMEYIAMRNHIAGIGEFLDFEGLSHKVEVVDEN